MKLAVIQQQFWMKKNVTF